MLIAFGLGIILDSWLGGRIADRVGPKCSLLIALALLLIIELVLPLVTTS
ncbi:hypothetical protein [Ktedonospora formicarum]|nr:hypothetical protein [Ktedonospora formicarum]